MGAEALQIKAPTGLPAKKANFKAYINQQLSCAIGLGAMVEAGFDHLRAAASPLCISQSVLTSWTLTNAISAFSDYIR
jgi:hypothetical protein